MISNPLSIGLYSVKPTDSKQTDYAIMHLMKSSEDYQVKTKSLLYMNFNKVNSSTFLRLFCENIFAISFVFFFACMNVALFLLN